MLEFVDTHCHFPKSFTKSQEWLDNAQAAGVMTAVNIGTSFRSNKGGIKIAQKFRQVYTTISVYPNHELDADLQLIETNLRELLADNVQNKIVGIGECGFDITDWKEQRSVEQQQELFELHLKLAQENNLPVVLHNRNGDKHVLESLDKHPVKGVAHCFTQTLDFAQELIKRGWFISFSGMVTFSTNTALRDVVSNLPLEKIVIETDAPYLVPEHLRGQGANEPKNVVEVAKVVAKVKGLTLEEVAKTTTDNAKALFSI